MIHELLDPKKKAIRGNASKNNKALNDYSTKPFFDGNNIHFEQSDYDNENKEAESQSNTFIPPWLRNSLGLSQRNNQNLDWSVCLPNFTALGHVVSEQKAARTVSKCKEQINKMTGGSKLNASPDLNVRVTCDLDNLPRKCSADIINYESLDVPSAYCNERATTVLWNSTRRDSDNESLSAASDINIPKREDPKVIPSELNNALENERVKEEEKKKQKTKQKSKIKKKNLNEFSLDFMNKNEVDCSLKIKEKEILGNYETKNVYSVSSDTKQLESKLIPLSAKCRDPDISRLNPEELQVFQEIKEESRKTEDSGKLMGHNKGSNVKEWLKISNGCNKINSEKIKKEEVKINKSGKEIIKDVKFSKRETKPSSDKESLKSTDEENDIKRFSEFLSNNKNFEEKRKCLEEVRNYFEKKRRTRLTKRRCSDDYKTQKREDGASEKKDDFPKEIPSFTKETVLVAKDKNGTYVPCNEEVVEKAVSETLQKFMSLYHFHVSPSMMGSMRKNILQAIQSDSVDSNSSKKNLPGRCNFHENTTRERIQVFGVKNDENLKETQQQAVLNEENVTVSSPLYNGNFEKLKKTPFKILGNGEKSQTTHSVQEKEKLEHENFKRQKKELENYLKSLQFHADGIGFKIQSLVLEKEETSATKGVRLVYNFSKKSLEFAQLDFNQKMSHLHGNSATKTFQDVETQTSFKPEPTKKSVKNQTISFFGGREQGLQTHDKIYLTSYAQTEPAYNRIDELTDITGLEISPGLYRLVKSKNIGRFYLYPEKNTNSETEIPVNDVDFSVSKSKNCDSVFGESASGKMSLNGKLTREMRIFYTEKDRGKIRGTKRKKATKSTSRRFCRKNSPNANTDDSVSCLFFRKAVQDSRSCETSSQLEQEFSLTNVVADTESDRVKSKDDHFGCIWLWNGEKISPGSDLKTHVEDLLEEKLNEIHNLSKPSLKIHEASQIEEKTTASQDENEKNNKLKASRIWEKKSYKDVGIQNSQQAFLSLNISKIKSQSVTSITSKVSTVNENKNADVKTSGTLYTKKTGNLVKAIKKIKRMKFQENIERRFPSERNFEFERNASSSMIKNESENSLGSSTEWKNKTETGEKNTKILSAINSDAQIFEIYNFKNKKLMSNLDHKMQEPKMLSQKHWELIESMLNRSSLKERGLWSDLRRFIKKKIGRDINDEEAQEVCIEIEQEVPKTESGKVKQAVMARGHYVRNKGDIEVEIDLTLGDLERILRQRKKKIRRKKVWNSKKAKKLFSSSSAQGSSTRKTLLT